MPQTRAVRRSTPFVSVDDVRRGALPGGTELVAGSQGLGREVVWCAVLRGRSPAFDPLRGGELVLVDPALIPVVDPRLTLAQLIDSLHAAGSAGMVLRGRADPASRRAAEALSLPLFELGEARAGLD